MFSKIEIKTFFEIQPLVTQPTTYPCNDRAVSCISSRFQTKRSSHNEVKCFNTELYGENTTFILYFNV